jgi:hypothetical protein
MNPPVHSEQAETIPLHVVKLLSLIDPCGVTVLAVA